MLASGANFLGEKSVKGLSVILEKGYIQIRQENIKRLPHGTGEKLGGGGGGVEILQLGDRSPRPIFRKSMQINNPFHVL